MASLAIGQTSDCSNPVLDLFTQTNGILANVAALEFQIFDRTGSSPVQVYPATVGQRATVDVGNDCPVGGRLSTGHYVALWTVPSGTTPGTYEIRWFLRLTLSTGEQTYSEEFEVLPEISASGVDGYTTVAAMRAEGVTTTQASDARLLDLIADATALIEQVTGLFFKPRELTVAIDAPGTQTAFLSLPIIGISRIRILDPVDSSTFVEVPLSEVVVYNRHLTQRLLRPDDRRNPRIVRKVGSWLDGLVGYDGRFSSRALRGGVWREGFQNLELTGVFGYTDPVSGPNQQGATPRNVVRACAVLVARELELLTSPERTASRRLDEIKSESTRDQSISYGDRFSGLGRVVPPYGLTGDPDADALLALFRPPMQLGVL